MAIFASDNFNDVSSGASISGRTLNNGIGGTGSRSFVSNGTSALVGTGAGGVGGDQTAWTNVIPGQLNYKVRFRFDPLTGTSAIQLTGRKNTATGNASYYGLRLAPGHTSLVIWEGDGTTGLPPLGTSRASTSLSAPGVPFYLEAEFNGEVLTGKVIRASDSVVLATVTYTFSAGRTGTYLAFGFADNGGTGAIDDLVFEDVGGATAPTLTTPTASATSPTTSTGSVSTDQADGTLYWLTNTSSTATATAVKAGSSQAVTATGTQTTASSGLTTSTTYYTHFLHRNTGGLDSAVVTSASFTTPAPAVPPTMNGSITVGTKTSGSISISYPAASDPVGVTGYEVSKDGTTWLDNGTSLSYTFLGLVPLTSYTLSVRAYNAAGLRASPALSVTTSTYREGATGQYIVDNTGPIGDNPAGFLYDDVDLPGDANKWFSYRVTTPPANPDAITLNPDGSFIFTGLVADSFYYQLEVDGEDVGVPQEVTISSGTPPPITETTQMNISLRIGFGL